MARRQSAKYRWCESDQLGRGSYGEVFKCNCKGSTDLFAVKVFKRYKEGEKEYSIGKKVNHPNVVRMLDAEDEDGVGHLDARGPCYAIIMEYCNDGNLQAFISKRSKNAFGLQETDLLDVFHDLVSGLKYLRRNDIAHRDIKPLNILRTITTSGIAVYKLADLGAARFLRDGDSHSSLVGTAEFMHPVMWLHQWEQCTEKFKVTCDLWSFGVTIYFCITGKLPFPKISDDKRWPKMILNERGHEAISYIEGRDGAITWIATYPPECLLPRELQDLFLPIQRRLFETRKDRTWTYDDFFRDADELLTRKKIQLVDVCRSELHNLYLPQDCRLDSACREVMKLRADGCLLLSRGDGTKLAEDLAGFVSSRETLRPWPDAKPWPAKRNPSPEPLFAFHNGSAGRLDTSSCDQLLDDLLKEMNFKKALRVKFFVEDASARFNLIARGIIVFMEYSKRALRTKMSGQDSYVRQLLPCVVRFINTFVLWAKGKSELEELLDTSTRCQRSLQEVKRSSEQLRNFEDAELKRINTDLATPQWNEVVVDVDHENDPEYKRMKELCLLHKDAATEFLKDHADWIHVNLAPRMKKDEEAMQMHDTLAAAQKSRMKELDEMVKQICEKVTGGSLTLAPRGGENPANAEVDVEATWNSIESFLSESEKVLKEYKQNNGEP